MEEVGFTFSVLGEIPYLSKSLRTRCTKYKQGPEQFEELISRLHELEDKVNGVDEIEEKVLGEVFPEAMKNLRKTLTSQKQALEKSLRSRRDLDCYFGYSSGSSSLKTSLERFFRANKLSEKMEKIDRVYAGVSNELNFLYNAFLLVQLSLRNTIPSGSIRNPELKNVREFRQSKREAENHCSASRQAAIKELEDCCRNSVDKNTDPWVKQTQSELIDSILNYFREFSKHEINLCGVRTKHVEKVLEKTVRTLRKGSEIKIITGHGANRTGHGANRTGHGANRSKVSEYIEENGMNLLRGEESAGYVLVRV